MRSTRPGILVAFVLATLSPLAAAAQTASQPTQSQPAESQPASQPGSQPASSPSAQSQPAATAASTTAQAEPEDQDRYLAVINGRVHTVTGPVLERATVLSRNGVITAIGTDVKLPPECEVIDAHGFCVYPGLIAVAASGIHGGGNPEDTTDVYSLSMTIALAGGITSALTGNSVAKLTFGTTEDMLVRDNVFVNIPYSRRNPLARAELHADLERVRGYLRDLARHEQEKKSDPDAEPPDKEWLKGKYENYLKLLQHQTIASFSAQTTQDLRDIADLVSTYGFRAVVRGGYEGWTVASELGRAGIGAIINARVGGLFGSTVEPDERLNRPTGATIENARILHDHGVIVAIVPSMTSITLWGLAGRDLLHLNMEAAFAVRGGMSNDDALETITINAARILGVDDRVGSLEIGKDADLIVCDGDILHYMTQVHYTIVNGRVAYRKAGESLFAHIRPEGKPEVPDFDDQWPRRLEWSD